MRGILRRCFVIALAAFSGLSTAGCGCPNIAGPTAPAASVSATLAPGEFRYLDADTPRETTQINLRFNVSSVTATLGVRQVDPACLPTAADNCPAFSEQVLSARPAGVTNFGANFTVTGAGTRIVVQDMSADETITLTLTVEPYRACCEVVSARSPAAPTARFKV